MVIVACGTSYHAGLVGKFLVEKVARIPCEVDLASEFATASRGSVPAIWSWNLAER